MSETLFQQLLDKYTTHSITNAERQQLYEFLQSGRYTSAFEKIIDTQFQSAEFDIAEDDELRQLIFNKIQQKKDQPAVVRSLRTANRQSFNWKRIAIAASILLIIGLGTAALVGVFTSKQTNKPPIAKTTDVKAPDKTKAVITLADGRVISLDSLTSLTQGEVVVTKDAEGKIVYSSQLATQNSQLVFNTLSNPRGSKVIDMTLQDGSHVWLNAGSSVTYPVAFVGNDRKVSITGEAYFEISHNKQKPFIVSANNKADVTVLGTHFNVNAYDDENDIKVTLLEGSVKVSRTTDNGQRTTLSPGQQAVLTGNGQLTTNNAIDVDAVMAWKNGTFYFNNTNIEAIMRQVARWYDVDIAYQGNFGDLNFGGTVSRKANVSELLKRLEATESVRFIVEGRKITVIKK